MKPKYPLLLLCFFSLVSSKAQTTGEAAKKRFADSLKILYLEEAAVRSPLLRQVIISTDFIAGGSVDGILDGNKVYNGKANRRQTSALFKVPVMNWGKNSLSATISYFQQHMEFTEVSSPVAALSTDRLSFDKSSGGLSLAFSRLDSLFGKRVVYIASVSGASNDLSSIRRMSYLAGASFALKQNKNTSLRLGLIVYIDPFTPVPVFPMVIYWHRFASSNLELSFDPARMALRHPVAKNAWASVGTSFSLAASFSDRDEPSVPHDVNYAVSDLKAGAGLEVRLLRKLMLGVEGGMMNPLSARAFEQGESSRNYFFKNDLGSRPYFNFTLSLLPFKIR